MQPVTLQFGPAAWFRFELGSCGPAVFQLSDHVRLLHPLLVGTPGYPGTDVGQQLRFRAGNTCILSANEVVFLTTSHVNDATLWALAELTTTIFRRLRYLARQAWLPPEIHCWSHSGDGPELPLIDVDLDALFPPEPAAGLQVWTNAVYLETAITLTHLREACSAPANFAAPAYSDVLLDAAHALDNKDYRRTILYAAIAVEGLAQEVLAGAHDRLLAQSPTDPQCRVVAVPDSGGSTQLDPVYAVLERSDSFRMLLHEKPLYLLKRSLLVESPNLFARLQRLYKTRNDIAHGKTPDGSSDTLRLTVNDAKEAFSAAREAFAWFGEDTRYYLRQEHVNVLQPLRRGTREP